MTGRVLLASLLASAVLGGCSSNGDEGGECDGATVTAQGYAIAAEAAAAKWDTVRSAPLPTHNPNADPDEDLARELDGLHTRSKAEAAAKASYFRQARLHAQVITGHPGCFSAAKRAKAAEFLAQSRP